jgi:hypothetical protein
MTRKEKKKKKKKKDKNVIEMERHIWDLINKKPPCEHPLVNNYTNKCIYCGKEMKDRKKIPNQTESDFIKKLKENRRGL